MSTKKTLKNYTNGNLSVTVTKIEQAEEIIDERPLNPNEDFSTFHPNTMPVDTQFGNPENGQQNTPFQGTYNKNIGGFGITVTRKLR
jgi:hypothetical protein